MIDFTQFGPPPEVEKPLENLAIRYTELTDVDQLKNWLLDPTVASWFPMDNAAEIDDAARRWIAFARIKSSITALFDGVPCGIATFYPQAYKKLVHQSELSVIVAPGYRDKGIGTFLMKSLMRLAKEQFHLELLHLQVYEGNPAINFYKRLGFREFGRQSHWIKEKNRYVGRIFMERFL